MRSALRSALAVAGVAVVLVGSSRASAEIKLAEQDDWRLAADARLATFLSMATGKGQPDGTPEQVGAGTTDTKDTDEGLNSARIRNGFMTSILGFNAVKQVSENLKLTTRVGLWMNISGSRTKNISALVDPRELYAKLEGPWGSFLAGSDLALFGRGGIQVDLEIAHEYGMGYPCAIRDASGGACGMVAFGATFPGFEPGLVYATPSLGGFQVSLGLYDPATIGHAQLDRAPLPRFEGEVRYSYEELFYVFGSGFWQVMEGTVPDNTVPGSGLRKNLQVHAWGGQAGAMLSVGPIMLGGAAMQGSGFGPITYVPENTITADSTGTLRDSSGVFGLGALVLESLDLKFAGGVGLWKLEKNENDSGPMSETGVPANPGLLKQNFGITVGAYQAMGPIHFALEYFRAQHQWHERGIADMANPNVTARIVTPEQTVNFFNAGMTVVW